MAVVDNFNSNQMRLPSPSGIGGPLPYVMAGGGGGGDPSTLSSQSQPPQIIASAPVMFTAIPNSQLMQVLQPSQSQQQPLPGQILTPFQPLPPGFALPPQLANPQTTLPQYFQQLSHPPPQTIQQFSPQPQSLQQQQQQQLAAAPHTLSQPQQPATVVTIPMTHPQQQPVTIPGVSQPPHLPNLPLQHQVVSHPNSNGIQPPCQPPPPPLPPTQILSAPQTPVLFLNGDARSQGNTYFAGVS